MKLERNQRLVYSPGSDGAKLKPVIVKAGITDGVDTEILDGIAEGAPVVTSTLSSSAKESGFGGPPPQPHEHADQTTRPSSSSAISPRPTRPAKSR